MGTSPTGNISGEWSRGSDNPMVVYFAPFAPRIIMTMQFFSRDDVARERFALSTLWSQIGNAGVAS